MQIYYEPRSEILSVVFMILADVILTTLLYLIPNIMFSHIRVAILQLSSIWSNMSIIFLVGYKIIKC